MISRKVRRVSLGRLRTWLCICLTAKSPHRCHQLSVEACARHNSAPDLQAVIKRHTQRADITFKDRLQTANSPSVPSLLLHFPCLKRSLQSLYLLRTRGNPLKALSPYRVILGDNQQEIADLKEYIHCPKARLRNREYLGERQMSSTPEESSENHMSGALETGARSRRINLTRISTPKPLETTEHDTGSRVIVAAYHRDIEPKLSQIWRKGTRAFVNDFLRREVARRLLDGEEIRLLDKETAALLDKELNKLSLEEGGDGIEDDERRLNRPGHSVPREPSRPIGKDMILPGQRTDTTSSSSTIETNARSSAPSAPSTGRAVVNGPTSADAAYQIPGYHANYNHGASSPYDSQSAYVHYGSGPISSRRNEANSRDHGSRRASDYLLPWPSSMPTREVEEAQDHLHPMREPTTSARSRRLWSHSVVPTNEARSTVASTRNLATWTELDDNVSNAMTSVDDGNTEGREDDEEGHRKRKIRKANMKVNDSERRDFYRLGRG